MSFARLPAECRPAQRAVFSINHHVSTLRVDVLPDGRLYYKDGSVRYSWISLDGITFVRSSAEERAAAAAAGIELMPGIQSIGRGVQRVSITRDDDLCVVQGTAKTWKSFRGVVATYPSECAPKYRSIFDAATTQMSTTRIDAYGSQLIMSGGSSRTGYAVFSGIVFPRKGASTKAVPLTAQWMGYGSVYGSANYIKQGHICVLNGLAKNRGGRNYITRQAWIGTVPAECRPKGGTLTFHVSHHSYSSRVDILTNGRIVWKAGTLRHNWISLSGIQYPVPQSSSLPLEKYVEPLGKGYRKPQFRVQGEFCILTGSIGSRLPLKPGYKLATLPTKCRPKSGSVQFITSQDANRFRLDIATDGDLTVGDGRAAADKWFSFDGVMFRTKS